MHYKLFGKVKQFFYRKKDSCITKQIIIIMQLFNNSGFIRRAFLLCSLILVVKLTSTMAQDSLRVEGIVLSQANIPVSEVSISVEGSEAIPVVSDSTGKFTLVVPVGSDWIIVSPAGDFKKQRIFLNSRSNITVYLTPLDEASGQDMVTVLSQNIQKRNMVAAFTSLNTENIRHTPYLSVDQYMQGRVPGMNVIDRSGLPGSGTVTNIRGIHTLNTSNQPLYVIDGIPLMPFDVFGSLLEGYSYNPLIMINPLDISKTTIVEDPVITSAYGSKGSNGVIFIETLDPSVTQTTIDFDIRGGYSLSPARQIPQLDAEQHKSLMNELLFTSPLTDEQIKLNYPNLYLTRDSSRYINYQHNTNWQDLIFSNSVFKNINFKVKGGDEIARYGLSFGYLNSDGIIKETNYQAYNLRFVSRLNIFKWLKMNAGVSLNYSTASLKEAATNDQTSPILTSLAKSPLLGPYQYDNEGKMLSILSEVDELGVSNPLATIENYKAGNNNYNFISSLNFAANINKSISINSSFSLNYNVLREQIFMPNHGMELYYNKEARNVSKVDNNSMVSFYNNTYLLFDKSIGEIHHFTSNTGININTNKYQQDWALTKNLPANDQYQDLVNGQNDLRQIGGENRNWNWVSYYEFITYSFKDKYIFNGSVSLDGSSRVGRKADNTLSLGGQPFGLFYAGGIAWRVSSESFLKNVSWLQDFKLRVGYGKTGNDNIGESTARNWYQSIRYRETVGLYPATIPNYNLTYESVSQLNVGADLSFFGNRYSAKFNYYISQTNDMLIFSPIDKFLGYDTRAENSGKMQNDGWDVAIFSRLVDGKSFKWDVSATLSSIINKVSEISGGQQITDITGGQLVNTVGAPANSFYGYIYKGVFSTQQQASDANLVNDRGMPFQAGDAIFEDISGPNGTPDGIINSYDKTDIGSTLPKYYGGLNTTFTYKRWALSGDVYFVYGNKVFNYVRYKNEQMYDLSNQSTRVLNRWQYEGQQTDVPRAVWHDPVGNSVFSSRWIEDGSYVRIKNITLSYKIPKHFLAFENAEFYVSANNIFTFSNYLGYDPEFAYSYSIINQGVDYGQMPQARQFIAGIKLGL